MPGADGENFSRHSPDAFIIKELKARRNLKKGNYHQAKTRYNAYVTVKSSITRIETESEDTVYRNKLPLSANSYDSLYANSAGKPDAVLNSVKIEQAGDYGSLITADIQYTCFRRSVFDDLEKTFMRLRDQRTKKEDGSHPPVELTIEGGYVNKGGEANNFKFERMILYKFGYTFNEQNQYVCTIGCMGSTHLIEEADVDKCQHFLAAGFKYMPGNRTNSNHAIEVANMSQLARFMCQMGKNTPGNFSTDTLQEQWRIGDKRIIDWTYNRPKTKRTTGGTSGTDDAGQEYDDWTYSNTTEKIERAGFIHDSLFHWAPDNKLENLAFKLLKRLRLISDDNTSHRFVSLQWIICCINEYLLPNTDVEYVCNKRVSSGAYLHPIVSSDPLTFILPGRCHYGEQLRPNSLKNSETLRCYQQNGNSYQTVEELYCGSGTADKQTVWKQAGGGKYSYNADYSKLLISTEYLANSMFGIDAVEESKEENDVDPETTGGGGLRVGPLLEKLFSDISTCFGGAVQIRAVADKDPKIKKVYIVMTNEPNASKELTPALFDPINGDGITRKSQIGCNPPSADAYAVAAGDEELPGRLLDTMSDDSDDQDTSTAVHTSLESDRNDARLLITKLHNKDMANEDMGEDQLQSCRSANNSYVKAQYIGDASETLPTNSMTWPLNLKIELDGIYGFRFGDLIQTTFTPSQYRGAGLRPCFTVTKVTHVIQNNDWSTSLETQCTLIPKKTDPEATGGYPTAFNGDDDTVNTEPVT